MSKPAAVANHGPRLHYGQQCPDCLHPWWAHETREPAEPLEPWQAPIRCCIGQDCHCMRLGPTPSRGEASR